MGTDGTTTGAGKPLRVGTHANTTTVTVITTGTRVSSVQVDAN